MSEPKSDCLSSSRVSVLVAVYRTEPEMLRETIRSVLSQTFADFELLLQDDCPDDPRESVVAEFRDSRISYAGNERNLGISGTRNRLIGRARGEYLAVLDHDDVCRADRLEREVSYMDAHPECGLVSSFTREIPSGRLIVRPVSNADIRLMMMGGCVIAHSAAMMRKSVLDGHGIRYEGEYSPSEDYRLFLRLMEHAELACIPEPLLDYRIHDGNTTQSQLDRMWKAADAAQGFAKRTFPELFAAYMARPRVVVSGGWSYGNLGDDAILEATGLLLKRNLPTANIVWAVYDRRLAASSGVPLDGEIVPSIHRLVDRRRSFWMMQTVGRSIGYAAWPKLLRKLFVKTLRGLAVSISAWTDRVQDRSDVFNGAAVYIMSGGGYFNLWPTMFEARIRELELAHANGCRVLLTGQSIGPFSGEQRERLRRTLRPTDVICVRDADSVAELASIGIHADLAPDLALSVSGACSRNPGTMAVVLGELDGRRELKVADQLCKFQEMTRGRFKLRLVQTCDIWSDVMAQRHVSELLRRRGVQVESVIPHSYIELKRSLEGCEWIVSRRMHGMVIGWRSGSKVFAFTKSRKIVGFLEAIGCPANICPEEEWDSLSDRLALTVENTVDSPERRADIAQEVQSAFAAQVEKLR